MKTEDTNRALSVGAVDQPDVLPRLDLLKEAPFVFRFEFGLDELPPQPGIILVRGPRQYGKSTWLEQQIRATVTAFGPGSAFYLNGDELRTDADLAAAVRALLPLYRPDAAVRRLFIDEITSVRDWRKAIKLLSDRGDIKRVLVVTTGSRATDLRRAAERLPGRKGKLDRTAYLFAPIGYAEFERVCGSTLGANTLPAYLLSGGSPAACGELAIRARLPEYVVEMTRDWILGEFAASGRSRSSLLGVMECLHRFAGTPVGQAKLAREAGLANNTVAAGYVELLSDLCCVAPTYAWDAARRSPSRRRPCKFHMTNLLAAVSWHPARPRSLEDYQRLPPGDQAYLLEWLVAQELWRRRAVRGEESPEELCYWRAGDHEVDFVVDPRAFLEVKRGATTPVEFAWFSRSMPTGRLTVVGGARFEAERMRGVSFEEFLRGEA